jgi:hypothetical protein
VIQRSEEIVHAREAQPERAAALAAAAAEPFSFPGMAHYLRAAAEAAGADPEQVGRAMATWHMGQIQDLLGQMPGMPKSALDEAAAVAMSHRDSMALAVVAADRAMAHVFAALGVALPESIHAATPQRAPAVDAGRKH